MPQPASAFDFYTERIYIRCICEYKLGLRKPGEHKVVDQSELGIKMRAEQKDRRKGGLCCVSRMAENV